MKTIYNIDYYFFGNKVEFQTDQWFAFVCKVNEMDEQSNGISNIKVYTKEVTV